MSGDKAVSGAASNAFGKDFGMGKAYATIMGATGTMAADEQEKQLEAARAAGQIAEAEYQAEKARIAAARKRAEDAVRANPYRFVMGGDVFAGNGGMLASDAMPDNENKNKLIRQIGNTALFFLKTQMPVDGGQA